MAIEVMRVVAVLVAFVIAESARGGAAASSVEEQDKNETFERFAIGDPVFTGAELVDFALDGDVVWLVEGVIPMKWTPSTGEFEEIEWPESVNRTVVDMEVGPELVCFATDGAGVVVHSKATGKSRHFGKSEGLLSNSVVSLALLDQQLWMGYRFQQLGGMGYIDLKHGAVTNLSPPINYDPGVHHFKTSMEGPPINGVMDLSVASDGTIWAAVEFCGLVQFQPDAGIWTYHKPSWQVLELTCVALAGRRAVLGGGGTGGRPGRISVFDLGVHQSVVVPDYVDQHQARQPGGARPLDGALDIEIDGEMMWIAGPGYVAVRELRDGSLKRLCDLKNPGLEVHTLQLQPNWAWAAIGNLLFRIPR